LWNRIKNIDEGDLVQYFGLMEIGEADEREEEEEEERRKKRRKSEGFDYLGDNRKFGSDPKKLGF